MLQPGREAIALALHFDNNRNMESKTIIQALAALAQESRLALFRLLVQTGPALLALAAVWLG